MKRASPLDQASGSAPEAGADPVEALVQLLSDLPGTQPAPAPAPAPAAAPLPPEAAPDAMAPAVPDADSTPPSGGARRGRSNRMKTTFLGFEHSNGKVDDVSATAEVEEPELAMFPAGWLVITGGPGRGAGLPVFAGVSQIGRGEDQTVQLNFGDGGISRSGHAVVAYDPEARQFYLGHGGKSNIVRRNGMPVLSTEPLEEGDEIRISETTLRFKPLCGPDFCWSAAE